MLISLGGSSLTKGSSGLGRACGRPRLWDVLIDWLILQDLPTLLSGLFLNGMIVAGALTHKESIGLFSVGGLCSLWGRVEMNESCSSKTLSTSDSGLQTSMWSLDVDTPCGKFAIPVNNKKP